MVQLSWQLPYLLSYPDSAWLQRRNLMNSQENSPREPALVQSNALYEKAKGLIPGGTMLLSKRPELKAPGSFPGERNTLHDSFAYEG